MIPGSLTYRLVSPDTLIVTTKKAIEDYVLHCKCNYLSGFMDRIWDKFRDDESEWDKAFEFLEYVDDAIKELKGDDE